MSKVNTCRSLAQSQSPNDTLPKSEKEIAHELKKSPGGSKTWGPLGQQINK